MTLPRTLAFRIVVASAALSALIVVAVSIYVLEDARQRSLHALKSRVDRELALIVSLSDGTSELAAAARETGEAINARVTVIGDDGRPIADSVLTDAELGDRWRGTEVAAAIASGSVALFAHDPVLGEEAYVRVEKVSARNGSAGFIRIAAPLSEVDDAVAGLRRNAIVGGILTVAAATALATVLAGRLTRSIGTVTGGVLRVASGDLAHRLRPEPPLEVEQLATAVNEMAGKLSQLISKEASERVRLASILSTMSDGVLVVDRDGKVDLANPAAMEMLDAPAGFHPGDRMISLNHNYELNRLASEAAESGESRQSEIELLESRRFLKVLAVPLPPSPPEPAVPRALLLLTDLTEMRRVETTRREFISNASHELRTPIAAISASVETLQAGAIDDPEPARDFLRRIAEDTARVDRMISELLELSRLESGQAQLHFTPVDPEQASTRAVDRFRSQAERAGLRLMLESDPGLPLITADEDKLDQVLSNLLGNAIRATPEGGSIEVMTRRGRGSVEFRVRDTGHGIEPEHLPHIFERFYKGDPARSDGGAGLGLAIARHIVEVHHGDIYVESKPGEGSTFVVSFPVSRT